MITCASSECHVTGGVTVSSTLPQLILPLYHQDCSVISDPTLMTIARASGLAPPPCSHMYAPTHTHTHTHAHTHTCIPTLTRTRKERQVWFIIPSFSSRDTSLSRMLGKVLGKAYSQLEGSINKIVYKVTRWKLYKQTDS